MDYLEQYEEMAVPNLRRFLTEQHRILRPGGIAMTYSMLFDMDEERQGLEARLPEKLLHGLPFSKLKRYSLRSNELTAYVDVFVK